MVKKTIPASQLVFLKSFIGSKFISWECAYDPAFARTYGNVRIHTSNGCFEIVNEEKPTILFDSIEDISGFSIIDPHNDKFVPASQEKIVEVTIGEAIKDVLVVSDEVSVNDDKYRILFDMAIIIVTDQHSYSFSRGWYFNELIQFSTDESLDNTYPVNQVVEDWSDDGANKVNVFRSKYSINSVMNVNLRC